MTDVLPEILKARGGKYGPFYGNAQLAQELKNTMRDFAGWEHLDVDMQEALDLIALKISRIVTGNEPRYLDNWDDLAGYAKLISNRIRKEDVKTELNQ